MLLSTKDSQKAKQEQSFANALKTIIDFSAEQEFPMSFNVIHGFLFGLCSAPVAISPMEWIPSLFGDNDDITDAALTNADTFQALVDFFNYMMEQIQEENPEYPQAMVVSDTMSDNFGMESDLGQWSQGFIDASEWLGEVWEEAMIDVLEEDHTIKSVMLSFFSDEEFSRKLHDELMEAEGLSFEDICEDFLKLLPNTLKGYAFTGRKLYEQQVESMPSAEPAVADPKVGRNDLCPCGSGKKYKKCCLH
ncbi:hypothetical protein A9Q99_15280 [Gammaproteobacteria bacterium 45_16_T64]|nr:hypothetical protein A9Q99_15280 [Gammaproteobacteria bacterium 45_16_T64]